MSLCIQAEIVESPMELGLGSSREGWITESAKLPTWDLAGEAGLTVALEFPTSPPLPSTTVLCQSQNSGLW